MNRMIDSRKRRFGQSPLNSRGHFILFLNEACSQIITLYTTHISLLKSCNTHVTDLYRSMYTLNHKNVTFYF